MANPVTEGIKAAQAIRKRLGIGVASPVDVAWIARKLEVLIVRKPLTDGLSGIHLAHASGRCFVAINSLDRATRQNFTLAHELGHVQFDRDQTIAEKIFADASLPVERRANAFAAELILPEAAVREWLATPHLHISPDEVARLAIAYHMSYLATLYRLKNCEAIKDITALQQARDTVNPTLRSLLSCPGENAFELPQEFIRMADEALSRAIISRRRHRVLTTPPEAGDSF
jgi:Zn-dependent peptidase ImmA (M78 family)